MWGKEKCSNYTKSQSFLFQLRSLETQSPMGPSVGQAELRDGPTLGSVSAAKAATGFLQQLSWELQAELQKEPQAVTRWAAEPA